MSKIVRREVHLQTSTYSAADTAGAVDMARDLAWRCLKLLIAVCPTCPKHAATRIKRRMPKTVAKATAKQPSSGMLLLEDLQVA